MPPIVSPLAKRGYPAVPLPLVNGVKTLGNFPPRTGGLLAGVTKGIRGAIPAISLARPRQVNRRTHLRAAV